MKLPQCNKCVASLPPRRHRLFAPSIVNMPLNGQTGLLRAERMRRRCCPRWTATPGADPAPAASGHPICVIHCRAWGAVRHAVL